jgi:activator of the mannose operon (transcriptional antiterminator)
MNERQQLLLELLLAAPKTYQPTKVLAEKLACSERTVRNDLSVLEKKCEEETWFTLLREPGKGISVSVDDEEAKRRYLQTSPKEDEPTTGSMARIGFDLLMATEPTPMSQLKQRYYLSSTHLRTLIDELIEWLHPFDIELSVKPRVGLTIVGNEVNKRRALATLPHEAERSSLIEKEMRPYEVNALKHILMSFSEDYTLSFTDESIQRLVVHILLMIKRVKLNQTLKLPEEDVLLMQKHHIYPTILELKQAIESLFSLVLKDDEVVYLAMHILGSKLNQPIDSQEFLQLEGEKQAEQLTELLIEQLSEKTMMEFKEDRHLREGLQVHVYATVHRLRYDLPVNNPLTKEIKQLYPFLFDLLIEIVTDIEPTLGFLIPEAEVAYLTLHFQAALERLDKDQPRELSVVVVCHMGIGVSEILKVRLMRAFPTLAIKATVPERGLKDYLKKEPIDLIVSTVPLALKTPPSVIVSPLLNEDDQAHLRMWADKVEQDYVHKPMSLKTYIHPGFIFIHQSFEHPYELIEYVTNRMVQAGVVEKAYPHQALLRERKASTAIGDGISIPHGDPRYVKQSTIALITLKEPMNWEGEDVSLVFMLALKEEDKAKHRAIYQQLGLLTEQPEKQAHILAQTSIKDVLNNL